MTKQPASVVHVRLPPSALEALRKSASDKGTTVHAEIIERLEASFAADEQRVKSPRQVAAVRVVVNAAVDRFGASVTADPATFGRALTFMKAALDQLFGMFGAAAPEPRDDEVVRMFIVDQLVDELRSQKPTPLGEAGRILLKEPKA